MIGRLLLTPKYKLITLPTPLEKAAKLSEEYDINLYVKRDDVMELAFGGNKARKLEYILADAFSKGCDTLITRGAYHSNHARLTAAAARKAGLEAYLVLYPPIEPKVRGNLLLDKLLGANIVYVESSKEANEAMERLAKKLEGEGKKPYIIPGGGASPHGVLGYAMGFLEIFQQLRSFGEKLDYIVHATGTGATQAGLILGAKLLSLDDVGIVGISVGRDPKEVKGEVSRLVSGGAKLLNLDLNVEPEDVIVFSDYTFGGYATITREVVATMKNIALKEGLILDPVYTAKAMYGLLDLVEKGYFKSDSTIVFLHTGGTPIPFQYSELVEEYL